MFELTVETTIHASHSIVIGGEAEPVHAHDWHITVCVAGEELDGEGLLVDFHAVERMLGEVVAPYVNRSFNDVPPFDRVNPTAEQIARHIGEEMDKRIRTLAWGGQAGPESQLRLAWVRLTEAPGCAVVYRPALGAARPLADTVDSQHRSDGR